MVRCLALLALALLAAGCDGGDESAKPPDTCPAGTTACGGGCADLRTDETSCGACGRACAAGDACVAGACRRTCATQAFLVDEALLVPVGVEPVATTAADADGDGLAELAVADARGGIDVVPQTARGQFGPSIHVDEGNGPVVLHAADMDEDGLDDLLVGELYEDRVLSLRATGDGTFTKRWVARLDAYVMGLATGDLDRDGHLDIVATAPDEGEAILLRGAGNGEFSLLQRAQFTNGPFAPAIGDFDGDGRGDAAFGVTGGAVAVVLFRRDEGYEPEQLDAVERLVGLAAGDFDGDGLDDLALAGPGGIHFLLGRSTGPFERLAPVPGAVAHATLLAGDVDGDGRPEVAAVGASGRLQVIGLEGMAPAVVSDQELAFGLASPALVDVDGDRALDLVGTWPASTPHPVGEAVVVFSECR